VCTAGDLRPAHPSMAVFAWSLAVIVVLHYRAEYFRTVRHMLPVAVPQHGAEYFRTVRHMLPVAVPPLLGAWLDEFLAGQEHR